MLWHFYCSPINIFVLWLSGYEHVVAFLLFSYKTSLYCGFWDTSMLWHFYRSPINVFVLWLSGYDCCLKVHNAHLKASSSS